MRRRRVPSLRLGMVLAVVLTAAACSSSSGGGDYVLGVLASQTGSASQLGVGEVNGARLAVDEINKAGGVKGHALRLVVADDQSSTQETVLQARSLLQQHVLAIVGPSVVADCLALGPLVTSSGPTEYCLSPGIQPSSPWVWSASVSIADIAKRLMQYWSKASISRIGLIATTDATGRTGAQAAKSAIASVAGMTLVKEQSYAPDAVDVTPQLQQILAAKPQAVVVWATGTPSGVALKGLQQLGANVPVATTNGNLANAFLTRIADFQPATLLIPATRDFWWQGLAPGSVQYQLEDAYHRDYQARFGQRPDFGPGVAYDAVRLIAEALKTSGPHPAALRSALEQLRNVPGVVGTYSFSATDHRGLGIDDIAITKVTNGTFAFVGT